MRGFLFGAVMGAVAAMLVAPRRGEETREMLRSRAELWQDQVMSRMDQARAEVQSLRGEVLSRLDEMRSQMGGAEARPGMVVEPRQTPPEGGPEATP